MKRKEQGFTLVELVVVIVVLGILAAFAIPRYASYVREARIAALSGLAGAVRSAVAIAQARYIATGQTTSPVTMMDNTNVAVSTAAATAGIPLGTAGGIDNAVKLDGTFTYDAANTRFDFASAITNCWVTYDASTGTAAVVSTSC